MDESVKQVAAQTGVLAAVHACVDSFVLDDAFTTQDTVTPLVAAIRKVRKLVRAARQVVVSAHDYDRGGKRDCAWDDKVAATRWSPGWSPTRRRSSTRSRWSAWRRARAGGRAVGAGRRPRGRARRKPGPGGSPVPWPVTGSCPRFIRSRGKRTSLAAPNGTGAKPLRGRARSRVDNLQCTGRCEHQRRTGRCRVDGQGARPGRDAGAFGVRGRRTAPIRPTPATPQ